MNIKILKQMGSEWQKGDMRRIYFNDLEAFYGLKVWYYNSGNVSGAFLDGQDISNTSARKYLSRLNSAKVYYDLTDNKFHGKGLNQAEFDKIVAAIKAKVTELEVMA